MADPEEIRLRNVSAELKIGDNFDAILNECANIPISNPQQMDEMYKSLAQLCSSRARFAELDSRMRNDPKFEAYISHFGEKLIDTKKAMKGDLLWFTKWLLILHALKWVDSKIAGVLGQIAAFEAESTRLKAIKDQEELAMYRAMTPFVAAKLERLSIMEERSQLALEMQKVAKND